jgi:hypothetical protein
VLIFTAQVAEGCATAFSLIEILQKIFITHIYYIFTTQVAEGYATAFSLMEFLQKKLPRSFRMDLKFPILFGVAQVLKGERRHVCPEASCNSTLRPHTLVP